MRICVLQSSYESSESPCSGLDPDACPELWLQPEHQATTVKLLKSTAAKQLIQLAKENFDVFLNLCDGAWDEDRAGIEVVDTLERLNVAYTGADRNFYEPSKELMKKVALFYEVKTAPFFVCHSLAAVAESVADLSYPVIVKHHSGYNSVGMTKDSRCQNLQEVLAQAEKMIWDYGGALIEEFIDGGEYTVLVTENLQNPLEPLVLTPVECQFPEGETFKHFDLKWVNYEGLNWKEVSDPSVSSKLREMAQKVFLGLGGVGYGRIDARSDGAGNVFFLEMNPNCGIFYHPDNMGSADYILTLDPTMDHAAFIRHIIDCALVRHRSKQPIFTSKFIKARNGFGLYSLEDLKQGAIVDNLEEKPFCLVSKTHVSKTWRQQEKQWFKQYAYPFSENVWGMWSKRPEDWKPVNHSCDPSVWLDGLNMVARRDIARGEELTIDYAT
eukprot:jgi/Mesen1/236/ME1142233C07542